MRVLVLDSDYPDFLRSLYAASPGLERAVHAEQLEARRQSLFGTASAYAAAFRDLGHEAEEVFLNNGPLQLAWAREHGVRVPGGPRRFRPSELGRRAVGGWRGLPGYLLPGLADRDAMAEILLAQVDALRPDLVLNQDLGAFPPAVLDRLRASGCRLVGQHAATPLPDDDALAPYDLLVSSFQPTVEELERRGFAAGLSRLGFDPRVLDALGPPSPPEWGLTFVGSLAPIHSSRLRFLEALAELLPDLRVWSPHRPGPRSPLAGRYLGAVWGRQMFRVLAASRATLNHHGDIPAFANNMRLYEATGVGTLLLTDAKPNLADLFSPGVEVLAYTSAEDCAAQLLRLADAERDRIAAAGQRRTLTAHTYRDRVAELLELAGRG
jgi:hypothetical protein